MRVMIDTNVLLSAALFRSLNPSKSIEVTLRYNNVLQLPAYVIDEARAVIRRKWPSRHHTLEDFLTSLDYETAEIINTPPGLFEIRDPKDYPILYFAIQNKTDILVTGDKDFLDVRVEHPDIMTPAEFVAHYW